MERLGQKWLKEKFLAAAGIDLLSTTLNTLQRIYSRHIEVEDKEVFPLAAKVLNEKQLAEVGQEMAARRGQSFISGWDSFRR